MDDPPQQEPSPFDFAQHEQAAVVQYLKVHGFYQELASVARRIADEALKRRSIQIHSIEARAKDPASFGRKASKPSKDDPGKPRYDRPLEQITDLAAIRLITFFPRTIGEVNAMLRDEFEIVEYFDKGQALLEEERFGYKSVHYLLKLNSARANLPEYHKFREAKVEVQVRTILQHAWAEIEHDIQYKSSASIPRDIKRRFMSLAGLLEIADREFQAIQDADRELTERAVDLVNSGQLDRVEITPGSLKTYLDRRLGPDGRMSEFSYDWTVRLLRKLGFSTLAQVDDCVRPYDDDRISRIAYGTRQGQLSRFEAMLLAGLGERFVTHHLYADEAWWGPGQRRALEAFSVNAIPIGTYENEANRVSPDAASGASQETPSK